MSFYPVGTPVGLNDPASRWHGWVGKISSAQPHFVPLQPDCVWVAFPGGENPDLYVQCEKTKLTHIVLLGTKTFRNSLGLSDYPFGNNPPDPQ